jgi:hypothetical protein
MSPLPANDLGLQPDRTWLASPPTMATTAVARPLAEMILPFRPSHHCQGSAKSGLNPKSVLAHSGLARQSFGLRQSAV